MVSLPGRGDRQTGGRGKSAVQSLSQIDALVAHARIKDYKPATALIRTYQNSRPASPNQSTMLIEPEDIPGLLSQVADLISQRATRRVERELRLAGAGV